jgi:hypothetical protein
LGCQFRLAWHVGGNAGRFVAPIDPLQRLKTVPAQDSQVAPKEFVGRKNSCMASEYSVLSGATGGLLLAADWP